MWHQRPNSLLYLLKETFTFAVSSNMQTSLFISIVKVRETRLSGLVSHILIGLSLLMLPMPLQYIPPAVLDGLFLFVAITSLSGNQMFERALLLVTEQVTLGWRRGSHCPHYQHYFHEDTNSKMELQNQNPWPWGSNSNKTIHKHKKTTRTTRTHTHTHTHTHARTHTDLLWTTPQKQHKTNKW